MIDDNEYFNFKIFCDEIFGVNCYLVLFMWKRRFFFMLLKNNVFVDYEYIFCYSKINVYIFWGIDKDYSFYSNLDNDLNGLWILGDLIVGMIKD